MKKKPHRIKKTSKSTLRGVARGELILVEYALGKAAREQEILADRLLKMAECIHHTYEKIKP